VKGVVEKKKSKLVEEKEVSRLSHISCIGIEVAVFNSQKGSGSRGGGGENSLRRGGGIKGGGGEKAKKE